MKIKTRFIKLLRLLDRSLETDETLVICGGMALILAHGGTRQTLDIDVIAPVPLNGHLKEKVKEIARQLDEDPSWLNDAPKGFGGYLPTGWEGRLIPVDLKLNKLKIFSLGKPDLILMKLKAGRPKDISDILSLDMNQEEADIILSDLERIAKFDGKSAHTIQLILEEWGFVKKHS